MSGRSGGGGNRRGKETKASSNAGKMGGLTQPNLQKHSGGVKEPAVVNNDKQNIDFSSKLQPTAEQIRLATLIQDSSKTSQSDEETASKIRELMDLTKCDGDKAALVLHDCDYDLMKAVDVILEGGQPIEQQWTESISRKKKKQQNQPPRGEDGTLADECWEGTPGQEERKKEGRRGGRGASSGGQSGGPRRGVAGGSGGGGASSRGPPRLRNRGRGGGAGCGLPREGEGRGRDAEAQEDGSRSRWSVNGPGGPGRGRGRDRGTGGRGPRTFRNRHQSPDVEGFPQSIDTWTNSQAEGYSNSAKTRDLKVGKWDDSFPNADDWDNEEWTGSLADTRVFTPSSVPANPAAALTSSASQSQPPVAEDRKVEELPKTMLDLGSSGIVSVSVVGGSSNGEQVSSCAPLATSGVGVSVEPPVGPNLVKGIGGPPGLNYAPHHQASTTLDLATLLGTKQPPSQQARQPTEVAEQRYIGPLKPVSRPSEMLPAQTNDSVNLFPQMSAEFKSQASSNVPVQRSQRMKPRPSKIPSTAVEMPHDPIAVLDVQFGGLPFSEISSPPGAGPTVASDPSIVSYSVASSGSEMPPIATTAADRKPTASPGGASYYSRSTHSTPPLPAASTVSSTPVHPPPSSSAGPMQLSDQSGVTGQQTLASATVSGPYSTAPPSAQSVQSYQAAPAGAVYGSNAVGKQGPVQVSSVSDGTETAVTGGAAAVPMYSGAYQPNLNGTVTVGSSAAAKMVPSVTVPKDLPTTSIAYRQAVAPAKDMSGNKVPLQMGYAAPVTAGPAGMPQILGHQYYVAPPHAGPTQYYPQHVYTPVEDLSMLTQRLPPMPAATAAGVTTVTSSRDASATAAGSLGQGHHLYPTPSGSGDKFSAQGSVSTVTSSASSVAMVGQGQQQQQPQILRGGDVQGGSPGPGPGTAASHVHATAPAPATIPVSQPAGGPTAHYALPQLFMYHQPQYQGMVPTTFPGAAFQTPIYPVPQATNNVHGHGSSSSSQYQKPNAFVQHAYSTGYDHMGSADYGKSYMGNSKSNAASGIGGGAAPMQGSDVLYANKKVAAYEKFNPSTPPLAPTAAPSPHFGQLHPAVMIPGFPAAANAAAAGPQAPQHPSMMPVHPQSYLQDGSGANARNSAGMSQQNKVPSKPGYGGWGGY